MRRICYAILVWGVMLGAGAMAAQAAAASTFDPFKETRAEYDARAQWLRDAKFGVFIHWNPSSLIGKEISWCRKDYGKEKYDELYKQFKGENFNADQWVKLFHDSGIRYAVIVPKHHDGFSMFDTKTSDYKVMNSPFGRDYVKEMAEACGRGGVKFCLYYSILDWWNPKFLGGKGASLTAYKNEVFKPHMQELLTQYGPVGYIWFDGCWSASWTHADGREMYDFIRRLQPATLIGNRIEPRSLGGGEIDTFHPAADGVGDFQARERSMGDYYTEKAWDKCIALAPSASGGWSWTPPMRLRSADQLIEYLIQCIGRDGAMLLGVGPRPDGTIDPTHAARLLEIGNWLKVNGDAVYGTRGGPFLPSTWGVSTRKGEKIYLFVSRWKQNTLELSALPAEVKSARLLSGGTVTVEKVGGNMVLRVPDGSLKPVGTIATVMELTLDRDAMTLPVVEDLAHKNLALGKPVEVPSVLAGRERTLGPENITDGKPDTLWAKDGKSRDASVMVDLQAEYEVSEAMLSDAPYRRTQAFDLEAKIGDDWKTITSGTTIGNELYLDFEPVKARYFRLNIRKAKETPTLAEFQLFKGNIRK